MSCCPGTQKPSNPVPVPRPHHSAVPIRNSDYDYDADELSRAEMLKFCAMLCIPNGFARACRQEFQFANNKFEQPVAPSRTTNVSAWGPKKPAKKKTEKYTYIKNKKV